MVVSGGNGSNSIRRRNAIPIPRQFVASNFCVPMPSKGSRKIHDTGKKRSDVYLISELHSQDGRGDESMTREGYRQEGVVPNPEAICGNRESIP